MTYLERKEVERGRRADSRCQKINHKLQENLKAV